MGLDLKTLALSKTSCENELNSIVSNHNISDSSHSDIRDSIHKITAMLNDLADSDDISLEQLSEAITYIRNNKDLLDDITTSKVNVSDIIDNLTSDAVDKPLSAKQGKILSDSLIKSQENTIKNAKSYTDTLLELFDVVSDTEPTNQAVNCFWEREY